MEARGLQLSPRSPDFSGFLQPACGRAAQARGQRARGGCQEAPAPRWAVPALPPPAKPSTMGTICPCSVHAPDALIDFQTYPSVGSAEVTSPVPVCFLSWRYKLLHSSSSFAFSGSSNIIRSSFTFSYLFIYMQ